MNVRYDREGDVVILTLDRPDRLNALDDELTHEVVEHLERVSFDPTVGALILTGSGRAFTAGGDLAMLADRAREVGDADEPASDAVPRIERVMRNNARVVEILHALPCPSVAAVNGACIGAGIAWAAACDLRIAVGKAFFDTAYLRLGLSTDFGVTWLLHDLLGPSVAADWLLRPRRISAAEAHERGFVSQVVDDEATGTLLNVALGATQDLAQVRAGAHAIRENLRDAREGTSLAASLDGEAHRFVAALLDPVTAERIAAASMGNRVPRA